MKTFITELKALLEQNGMFESQSQDVIDLMLEGEKDSPMNSRWNKNPEDYPSSIRNIIWETCKHYALVYIDEKHPKAWFRPCFLPHDQQREFLKQNNIYVS